jgi:dTDP-4-amino-4,6-dideoxygalactose transaminase
MPCDLARILQIGERFGLPVIEDAACATGSEIAWNGQWERVGRPRGDIACFSFHPRKVVTTGDGGMLTTANAAFDEKFRLWRQHSMNVPDTVRHGSAQVIYESYPELGFNYRMTDIQAAMGRVQLERLAEIIPTRRRLAARYADRLGRIEGLGVPKEPEWARSNWQSYCVVLPAGADQRAIMQALLDRGISTRRGVMNAHMEKAYRLNGHARIASDLDRSEAAQDRAIILPLYAQMSEDQVDMVADALHEALLGAAAVPA